MLATYIRDLFAPLDLLGFVLDRGLICPPALVLGSEDHQQLPAHPEHVGPVSRLVLFPDRHVAEGHVGDDE